MSQDCTGDIHQPHDKLFKLGFHDPATASAFLRSQLPVVLADAIDWTTLRLENGDFIDSQFRHSESDLLFSAKIAGSQAYLYVLFEHPKQADPCIALRLLRYMVRIWERVLGEMQEDGKLPVILPVVLAQNDRRWDIAENFRSLFDVPTGAEHYLPDFAFRLVQLAEIPFDKIIGSPDGILILRALKAEAIGNLLVEPLWDNSLLAKVSPAIFELVVRYVLSGDIDKAGFRKHISSIQEPQLRQNAMTLAQQFIEEGRQEGMERGMQKGMLIGQIRALQEVSGVPLTPENALLAMPLVDLEEMLSELKFRVLGKGD